jgi:hypothetical protein
MNAPSFMARPLEWSPPISVLDWNCDTPISHGEDGQMNGLKLMAAGGGAANNARIISEG